MWNHENSPTNTVRNHCINHEMMTEASQMRLEICGITKESEALGAEYLTAQSIENTHSCNEFGFLSEYVCISP